jgi:hypothetical protein
MGASSSSGRRRIREVNVKIHILTIALIGAVAPVAAQNAPAPAATKPIPRTADGKPDLSGVWQALGVSLTGETPAQPGGAYAAGRGAAPAGRGAGRGPREAPPYKPELVAKVRELVADPANSPSARCMLLGVPAITMNPMPLEIVQTPKKTVILYEVMRAYRIIPTDRDHPKDLDPTYMGDSVGHWEGDTYVVDVTGFNDRTWLDGAGHFHSDALHVVERYTRTPQDTIHYEVTAEDPNVLTKPWKVVDAQLRHPPREDRIMEYECDNNIDLSHIVKPGSR